MTRNNAIRNVLGSLAVAALLVTSCTWGGFDDLEKKAPVQVLQRPGKFSSPQFGSHMLALSHPDHPRTLVVSGQYTDVLAVIKLGDNGGIQSTRVASVGSGDLMDAGDRQGNLVQAMTRISDSTDGEPRILVGVPRFQYLRRVTITAEGPLLAEPAQLRVVKPLGGELGNLGGALAAGQFDSADASDWAVAEDDYTFFILNESFDASNVLSCEVPNSGDAMEATGRGLVAGRFFAGDPAGQKAFALGVPRNTGGEVWLYRFESGTVNCNAMHLTPPASEPGDPQQYGTALGVYDLNHDGVDDLVVGMPDGSFSRVFVYLSGGTTLNPTPAYTLDTQEPGAVQFGAAIGFVDLDGDGVKEIIVGDPQADYGDNLGRVHIFGADWAHGGTVTEEVVGDLAQKETFAGADLKEASMNLGTEIVGLDWGNPDWSGEELVVGASELIFVYYLSTWAGDTEETSDPR